ncbi:MAG: permease prefix domain 1-containing protein [Oscillospiraceae bacterium]
MNFFSDAALTIRNAEVQQEILQHTLDRYDDLIAAGKSEQEAYDEAVGGIGDVSELYEHKQAAEEPKKAGFSCAAYTGRGIHCAAERQEEKAPRLGHCAHLCGCGCGDSGAELCGPGSLRCAACGGTLYL